MTRKVCTSKRYYTRESRTKDTRCVGEDADHTLIMYVEDEITNKMFGIEKKWLSEEQKVVKKERIIKSMAGEEGGLTWASSKRARSKMIASYLRCLLLSYIDLPASF